jgi:hypothetical protein
VLVTHLLRKERDMLESFWPPYGRHYSASVPDTPVGPNDVDDSQCLFPQENVRE